MAAAEDLATLQIEADHRAPETRRQQSANGFRIRVARIGEDLPEVAEVLLDPVLVHRSGLTLLHAGVRLLPPAENPEQLARRLVGTGPAHLRG